MLSARLAVGLSITTLLVACSAEPAASQDRSSGENAPSDSGVSGVEWQEGTCENFSLTFGPVTLPSASKGKPYEVHLKEHAESGWYGVTHDSEGLPPGLELTRGPYPILRGIPISVGSFEFSVYATHDIDSNGCSTMPDPHGFRLDIEDEGDGGTEAGIPDLPGPR